MKNVIKILVVMIFCASCKGSTMKQPKQDIVGNWDAHNTYQGKSYVMEARFKPGGDYDAFDDGKLFVSGKYRLAGDTIFLKDGLCNMNYEGTYALNYIEDSLRCRLSADPCMQRRNGTVGLGVARVTSAKN